MDNDTTATVAEQVCPDCPHLVKEHQSAAGCLVEIVTDEVYTSPSGVKTSKRRYCRCQNSDEALKEFFAAKQDA